jgi:hypothetical protein
VVIGSPLRCWYQRYSDIGCVFGLFILQTHLKSQGVKRRLERRSHDRHKRSLLATVKELDRRGWVTKHWATKKDTHQGLEKAPYRLHQLREVSTAAHVVLLGRFLGREKSAYAR